MWSGEGMGVASVLECTDGSIEVWDGVCFDFHMGQRVHRKEGSFT